MATRSDTGDLRTQQACDSLVVVARGLFGRVDSLLGLMDGIGLAPDLGR